jgi:hypothetical protein
MGFGTAAARETGLPEHYMGEIGFDGSDDRPLPSLKHSIELHVVEDGEDLYPLLIDLSTDPMDHPTPVTIAHQGIP